MAARVLARKPSVIDTESPEGRHAEHHTLGVSRNSKWNGSAAWFSRQRGPVKHSGPQPCLGHTARGVVAEHAFAAQALCVPTVA